MVTEGFAGFGVGFDSLKGVFGDAVLAEGFDLAEEFGFGEVELFGRGAKIKGEESGVEAEELGGRGEVGES